METEEQGLPFHLYSRLHLLLRTAGLGISERKRHRFGGAAAAHQQGRVRAALRLPHAPSPAPAQAEGAFLSFSRAHGLPVAPGQAHPVSPVSLLAGTCRGAPTVGGGRAILPGHRTRSADPNWNGGRIGASDARGLSGTIPGVSLRPKRQNFGKMTIFQPCLKAEKF